jgi:hypothetical protein
MAAAFQGALLESRVIKPLPLLAAGSGLDKLLASGLAVGMPAP